MASDHVSDVTDANFDAEVISSDLPVLVDFSATWCGPCKALAPTIEALAAEYDGKIRVFNLDVDQARNTAVRYGVMSVPALVVFRNGEAVEQMLGNQPKAAVQAMIDKVLADTTVSG